ncbi:MAG: hypothetical protein M1834_005854 [Cirrosporium novae-zelandiae]|nr:MAG: hypothetical protein M1834_005854 [Cirrosporium novae-zelandiae]
MEFNFALHGQENFRLLELPPELVQLLESEQPPHLSLKSYVQDPSSSDDATSGHAVLCTDDKTFQIRQRQSSNSVFIIKPYLEKQANLPSSKLATSLLAIAQCRNTLELHVHDSAPSLILERLIPVFDADTEKSSLSDANTNINSKLAIFKDIPASKAECEAAWQEICAFELDGIPWRPDATTLKRTWEILQSSAATHDISLDQPFVMMPLEKEMEEDGGILPIFYAVIANLSTESPTAIEHGDCKHMVPSFKSCANVDSY